MTQKQFKLKLIGHKMITPSVVHLTFMRTDKLPMVFMPGQFITFFLPHQSGKMIKRSYSLASSPEEPYEIAIAVAPVANGFATHILFNLRLGDELLCMGPAGNLILIEKEYDSHYILVATGTGVAPYRAMLPQIAQRLMTNKALKVTLLLGVRYIEDLLYIKDFLEFEKQNKRFYFRAYLSRAYKLLATYQYRGYVQSAFETLHLNPASDLVYLCGNPHMIDESMKKLQEIGFGRAQIRREKYISSPVKS